jgi:hypothetical protein
VAAAALQANLTLQSRLRRMLESIARAQNRNADVREQVRGVQARRLRAAAAPTAHPAASRQQGQHTGVSWFWPLPDTPAPPPCPDSQRLLQVTAALPLVFRRAGWSEEERRGLGEGVLGRVQEQLMNEVLAELEAGLAAGGTVTAGEVASRQAPIRSLALDAPEVAAAAAAAAFSVHDWTTVAHRAVPGRSAAECRLQWLNAARPGLRRDAFSAEEDEALEAAVGRVGDRAWGEVAAHLGGARTPLACMGRHQQLVASRRAARAFSDADLARLNALVARHGQVWKRLAEEFGGGWEGAQLMHHWRRHQQRGEGGAVAPRKGKWAPPEDELLHQAVALYGRKWAKVGNLVPGRTDVQCRERYMNVLAPEVRNRERFTAEEDTLLLVLVPAHTAPSGAVKWAKVARELPGRTDHLCRKRWEQLTGAAGAARRAAEAAAAAAAEAEAAAAAAAEEEEEGEEEEEEAGAADTGAESADASDDEAAPSARRWANDDASDASDDEAAPSARRRKPPARKRAAASGGAPRGRPRKTPRTDEAAAVRMAELAEAAAAEPVPQGPASVERQIAPLGTSRSGRRVTQPARYE